MFIFNKISPNIIVTVSQFHTLITVDGNTDGG